MTGFVILYLSATGVGIAYLMGWSIKHAEWGVFARSVAAFGLTVVLGALQSLPRDGSAIEEAVLVGLIVVLLTEILTGLREVMEITTRKNQPLTSEDPDQLRKDLQQEIRSNSDKLSRIEEKLSELKALDDVRPTMVPNETPSRVRQALRVLRGIDGDA